MRLDRWIALVFLVIALIYGFTAFNFPILPFERGMAFLPNTLPKVLSVLAAAVSVFILVSPNKEASVISMAEVRAFNLSQATGLAVCMVAYALVLRPVGFITATTLFIVSAGAILGERKLLLLIPIALTMALVIWYLVQQLLGIFLSPWPRFI